MRKVFLPLVLFAFFFSSQASAQNINLSPDQYDARFPEGMVHFRFNDKKLIIKFREGVSEDAIQQYFATSGLFGPYNKEWKVPAPVLYRPVLKEGVSYTEASNAIKANSIVEYIAPVVWYKDLEQSLYDLFYVGLVNDGDISILRNLAAQLNFTVENEYPTQKNVFRCRVSMASAGNTFEIAKHLQSLNKFKWAEPDFIYTCKGHTSDPYYTNQWGINNTAQYGSGSTAGADMDVVAAWTQVTGNSSIKVAILDCFGSAAEFIHPDISFAATYDGPGAGFNSTGFTGDAHGINCAGIVAATGNNGIGTVGVAYGTQVLAAKIGTITNSSGNWSSTTTIMANTITWAWQNADIVSNSNSFGGSSSLIDNAISAGLVQGRSYAGTLFFSSNGNSNTTTVAYPASNTNTIAVAASSWCDQRKAPSSCSDGEGWGCDYGVGTDVAAPGIKWHSTDLPGANGYSSGDYYQYMNGTSSACPAAAAVTALIYSMNPTLSAANARYCLETTCEKVGGYTYTANTSGQPNGTWSNELGYGRINANLAVAAANCTGATNDNCSNAIALPLNASCSYTSGNLCRATQSIAPSLCSGFTANRAADVWYTVTPSGTSGTGVTITCVSGASTDVVLGLYSGSCSGLTLVQCVDATTQGGTETMTVTGLTSGTTYYVRVYDWDGSTLNTGFQICATQCGPTTPVVTPSGPVTICSPNTQVLTVSNPCTGCSFTWSGGGTGTTNTISATSTNTVTATNSCGTSVNSNSVSVTVDPLPVVPTVTPTGPVDICTGGSQVLTISNPCTGCTFAWSGGGTGTTKTVNTTSTNTVTATNSCGTSAASNAVQVNVNSGPVAPVITPSGPVDLCPGNTQVLTISNPCTGCTFAWSGGGTGTTNTVSLAGTYTATATNMCGTSANSNGVVINTLPLPVTPIVTPSGPVNLCSNQSQLLTISNPCSGCTFDWSNLATGSSTTVNTTGTYSATATNSCGTSASSNGVVINVTQQPNDPTGITATPASICLGNSSTLTVNGTLTTGATWRWYTGSCGGTLFASGPSITVSPSSTTTYYVRAENGVCVSSCSQQTINVLSVPTANAGADISICSGVAAQIGTTGVGGVSYHWTPGFGLSNQNVAMPFAGPFSTTTYQLVATSSNGCTDTDQVVVTVNALPNANAGPNVVTCAGSPVTIGTPLVTGYNYDWLPATALNSTVVAMPSASPLITTTYTLTVTNPGTGCVDQDVVVVNTQPVPTADAGPDVMVGYQVPVTIGGSPTGTGNGPFTYTWTPPFYLDFTTVSNPICTPDTTTTYEVIVTDINGCTDVDTIVVTVLPPCTPPTAAFSASQVVAACPALIDFTDQSLTSGATTWQWTIYINGGSPMTFTNQNPTGLLYLVAGSFSAELIVSDTCGTDTLLMPNYITITCTTAVNSVNIERTVEVYPNPTSESVNVSANYADNGDYQLIVQNVLGQTIYTRNVSVTNNQLKEQLSLAPYANGIYMLQLKGNGLNVSKKIEKR